MQVDSLALDTRSGYRLRSIASGSHSPPGAIQAKRIGSTAWRRTKTATAQMQRYYSRPRTSYAAAGPNESEMNFEEQPGRARDACSQLTRRCCGLTAAG